MCKTEKSAKQNFNKCVFWKHRCIRRTQILWFKTISRRVFPCFAESCRCEVFSFWWEAARWCLCVMASSGDAAVVPFTDQHSYLCSISRLSSSYKHPQPMALWCFYHCVYSEKSGKYVNFRTKRAGINNGLWAWLLGMVRTNVLNLRR